MEVAIGPALRGAANEGAEALDIGGYFDPSIGPTHDHPVAKKFLPALVRTPRKLTKIENQCSSLSSENRRLRSYIPHFDKETSTYQIKDHPKLKLHGSFAEAQALAGRITALWNSQIGKEFIRYLEGLGDQIELSLLKWEGRVQVVVDIKNKGRLAHLNQKDAPSEWITKFHREACDRFLEEIKLGVACLQIKPDHPQKDAILRIFKEMSMRSLGLHFLLKFRMLGKPVVIEYKQGENFCGIEYIEGISVTIDLEVDDKFGGLSKKTGGIIPVPIDRKYIVIHELIHAGRFLLREFWKAPDITQCLAKIVGYDPEKNAYECVMPNAFLNGFSDFEEQQTICGKGEYTENGFRHIFFDHLRWGHWTYDFWMQENPGTLKNFFVDPCGPYGIFNRVALMILRNDLIYFEPILAEASNREVEIGIRQVEKLLLSKDQKNALNLVETSLRNRVQFGE